MNEEKPITKSFLEQKIHEKAVEQKAVLKVDSNIELGGDKNDTRAK